MAKMMFGDTEETVVTRDEFPLEKAREVLSNETIAVLGYGVQGPAQAMNLRDNGFNVIVGQRKGSPSWDKAVQDGWVEGETLFTLEEAAKRGTFISYLLSDAGQMKQWPAVKAGLERGNTLCFSHGFAVTYSDKTGVVVPPDVDLVLLAPKGSGLSVRRLFQEGKGINASYAVEQDFSGSAEEKVCAYGIGVGSGYLFETTFKKEVYSDLVGERGVLMGALAGIMDAQYNVLRENGHSPSEAFNETVEELTQSLIKLVAENGMDWMYANCSTTAQRGALDWRPRFQKAVEPVFKELYESVASGREAEIVLKANSEPNYKERLQAELDEMHSSEIWRAGESVRKLRP
ncbi:MAG: ketol-acid reductoisomerase [Candidatus Dadabacteria bacterium]|nr:MAG: ketol-acid reductoisomerase [Candidatus Dadabacteria bacterium]